MYSTKSSGPVSVSLGLLALVAVAIAAMPQGWRTPIGSAQGAWISDGSGTTSIAASTLPAGGGIETADVAGGGVLGLLATSSSTSVTSGTSSVDLLGAQSVATSDDVSLLNGRITASRVIAISTVSETGSRTTADGDGTGTTGLIIDGVAYAESVAPNTRVDLPGAGYVILNEQVRGKGRGVSLTVNMLHVYLANGGQVVVASATSGNGA